MINATIEGIDDKNIFILLNSIKNGDHAEKEKAISHLIEFPSENAVKKTSELLKIDSITVRIAAIEILKKIGYCSIETIAGLLNDKNEDIRVYGCEILGSIKDKQATPYLIEKLYDNDENVRNSACIALGEIGNEEAVDSLICSLKDNDWIKFSAINSLAKIKSMKVVKPLFDLFVNDNETISLASCDALIDMGNEKLIDEVLEIIKQWNKKKRSNYIKIIIEKENESIFHKLKNKIGDELFNPLLEVIESTNMKSLNNLKLLTNFKNITACRTILNSLANNYQNEDEYNERLSLFAKLKNIWADNIKDLIDEDDKYLLPIVKVSGMENVKIDENILLPGYKRSSVDTKREIIKNIPDIVNNKGLSIIREAISDSDGHVVGEAMVVIGKMEIKEMENDIIRIAQKGFYDVRLKAIIALLKLDLNKTVELLKKFVFQGSNEDKKLYLAVAPMLRGEENLPLIEILLQLPDENIRKRTITVIGNFLDDKRYMEIFEKLLTDKNVPHEALKIVKDKRLKIFKDRMLKIFLNKKNGVWTRYYALLALGSFEIPTFIDLFISGLCDKETLIKIGCLKALTCLKDKRAIPYIKPLIKNADKDIKSTAEQALSILGAY